MMTNTEMRHHFTMTKTTANETIFEIVCIDFSITDENTTSSRLFHVEYREYHDIVCANHNQVAKSFKKDGDAENYMNQIIGKFHVKGYNLVHCFHCGFATQMTEPIGREVYCHKCDVYTTF